MAGVTRGPIESSCALFGAVVLKWHNLEVVPFEDSNPKAKFKPHNSQRALYRPANTIHVRMNREMTQTGCCGPL